MSLFCWTQREIFWRKFVTRLFWGTIDFHSRKKQYYRSQWCPRTAQFPTFFRISSFVFGRTKTFIQVWNYLRVSKWWHNFHFWVNYPFKREIIYHIYEDSTSSKEIPSQESYIKTQWMTFASTRYHFTVVVCGAVSHWERAFSSYGTVRLCYCLIRLTWEQPGALHTNGLSCSEFITVTGSSYTWTQSKREKFKSGAPPGLRSMKTRSHYVTNVSCASDNQLRGSRRGFDGIPVRIMPWERAVVKV